MAIKIIRKSNFNDLFPIWSLEDSSEGLGQIIFKDGRVGIGYKVTCVETERLSSGEYSKIGENHTAALAALPPDVTVQLLGYYYYLPYEADLQDKSHAEYRILMSYLERPVQQHQQYLFVSYGMADIKTKSPVNNLYVRKGKSLVQNPFKNIENIKERLESIAHSFVSRITHEGVKYERMDKNELSDVIFKYFNLEFSREQKYLSNAYQPHRDCLQVGHKLVGIASMDGQAKEVFYDRKNSHGVFTPTILPLGNELEIEHILSITWKSLDTEPAVRSLESRSRWTNNLGFLSSQAHETQSTEIREHIDEVTKGGRKLFDMNISVLFWGLEKTWRKNKDLVVGAFDKMGATAFIEETDTSALFFCNSPANSYQCYRWLEKITNENAAVYANYVSNYKSDWQGELLCDRAGSPVYADFYSPQLNGNNFMVIGPTGSGKSYTIGYMIIQRQERGERQIIIDVGGTYKTIFYGNRKAKFYEYDPSNPLKYNPFLIHRSKNGIYDLKSKENEEKPTFLINLIATICFGTGVKLEPTILAILGELLTGYYHTYNETLLGVPSIDGFYHYVLAYREQNLSDPKSANYMEYERRQGIFNFNKLIITLKQFAKGELYGEILNGDTFEDIPSFPLICFDLAKIKENPTLYPIVGMMITELATDILARYPDDIKRIYIDEAWSMLEGCMAGFIEGMYRTVRKIKGVIGIITQGISEIKKSGIGEIVKANSSTVFILNHTDTNMLEELCEYMGLTAHQADLAKSLRRMESWREIFVKQGEFAKVYRVEVPLYIQGLISSTPDDRNYIRAVAGENGENITLALNRWVEKKCKGEI